MGGAQWLPDLGDVLWGMVSWIHGSCSLQDLYARVCVLVMG